MENLGLVIVTGIITGILNVFAAVGDSIAAHPEQWWPVLGIWAVVMLLVFLERRVRRRRPRAR
jgi:hypothetical protein